MHNDGPADGRRSLSGGLRKRVNRVRRRWRLRRLPAASVVLLYHRVMPARDADPFGLVVESARFADHLAYLKRYYDVVPPISIVTDPAPRRRPARRRVAITFDDGYADNFHHAFPVLQRLRVPAVIFLATDYVDSGRPYWWERLQHVFFTGGSAELRFPPPVDRSYRLTDRAGRGEALRDAWRQVVDLLPEARESILRAVEPPSPLEGGRPLTWAQVETIHAGGLVAFGAHTGSHPRLSAVGGAQAAEEIVRSRDRIAQVLGAVPDLFAYPYGRAADYTAETQALVARAGFRAAFGLETDVVTAETDRFAVPRLPVGNWGVQRLEDELTRVWLRGDFEA